MTHQSASHTPVTTWKTNHGTKLRIPILTTLAVVAFGSILFGLTIGAVMAVGHFTTAKCKPCVCPTVHVEPKSKYEAPISDAGLPQVNEHARSEPKTGGILNRNCPTCPQVTVQPTYYPPAQPPNQRTQCHKHPFDWCKVISQFKSHSGIKSRCT